MLNLSYAKSPKLNVLLSNIDRNRIKILSIPLSKESEQKKMWNAKLARTYFSLSLSGNPLKRRQMAKLLSVLTPLNKRKLTKQQNEVLNYSQAQNLIMEDWYVNSKDVLASDIYDLYIISSEPTFGDSKTAFSRKQDLVSQLLDYIARGEDHPVVHAGVVQMQLRLVTPFKTANGRITRLLSQLYLYKSGYDMRGMLVLDEYWKRNIHRYKQEVEIAGKDANMTAWLEYFAEAVSYQTEKVLSTLKQNRKVVGVSRSFWELNKRQKQILSLLDNPQTTLRNDDIQKKFGVSQITASRDLAKLYKLGFIFRRGKGRSVYYTSV